MDDMEAVHLDGEDGVLTTLGVLTVVAIGADGVEVHALDGLVHLSPIVLLQVAMTTKNQWLIIVDTC